MSKIVMPESDGLALRLERLRLLHTAGNYQVLLDEAAQKNLSHRALLERLLDNEITWRYDRNVARLIKEARFPKIKTIDAFDWSHPTAIPKQLILNALPPIPQLARSLSANYRTSPRPVSLRGHAQQFDHLALQFS